MWLPEAPPTVLSGCQRANARSMQHEIKKAGEVQQRSGERYGGITCMLGVFFPIAYYGALLASQNLAEQFAASPCTSPAAKPPTAIVQLASTSRFDQCISRRSTAMRGWRCGLCVFSCCSENASDSGGPWAQGPGKGMGATGRGGRAGSRLEIPIA